MRSIARFIADDSIAEAKRFSTALRRSCQELGSRANLYPLADGLEQAGIRRRLHGAYLIFYRAGSSDVEVLRVLHGSKDWEQGLQDVS